MCLCRAVAFRLGFGQTLKSYLKMAKPVEDCFEAGEVKGEMYAALETLQQESDIQPPQAGR